MGGIQSKNALPDDPVFSEINNPYDVASYKRICAEFGVDPSTDFRYTRGKNGGLGTVYIWAVGPTATDYHYPDPDLALFEDERITDRDDSKYKANDIYFIRNDQGAENQLEHFVPNYTDGLTPTLETSAFQSLYGGQFTLSTLLINQIFVLHQAGLAD